MLYIISKHLLVASFDGYGFWIDSVPNILVLVQIFFVGHVFVVPVALFLQVSLFLRWTIVYCQVLSFTGSTLGSFAVWISACCICLLLLRALMFTINCPMALSIAAWIQFFIFALVLFTLSSAIISVNQWPCAGKILSSCFVPTTPDWTSRWNVVFCVVSDIFSVRFFPVLDYDLFLH